jgi:ParB-like chromosome segregation protein Spo0J
MNGDPMETRRVEELIPYDNNPRKNAEAVQAVVKSIKKHGQVKPIVISEMGSPFDTEVICCGHTTVAALKELGIETVGVIIKAFESEDAFVDLAIRDNRTSEIAEWDTGMLQALESEFDIDLQDMDFTIKADYEYEPEVEPDIEDRDVTDDEINRTQDRLDERYDGGGDQDLIEVTCPHCLEDFNLSKKDLS